MLALSAHTQVILLEQPRFSRQLIEFRKPNVEQAGDNLYIVRNAFGLRYQRVGRRLGKLAAYIDSQWFHAALKQLGIRKYIYWLTVNDKAMTWGIPREHLIFDCMDPNFFLERQVKFDRSEAAIAKRANIIFCSAHTLHEKMLRVNPQSFLLPNATAIDTIRAVETSSYELPELLRGRSRPIIGYMGTLDWRFDAKFVYQAAKELPDYTFALVGRVNHDQEDKIKCLRSLSNVVITGQVSYEEGHDYNKAFDVGLIPFTPGPMNDAINSVKMYMYLAAGKPIVSTGVEECRRNPFVIAAETSADFVRAVRQSVNNNRPADVRARIEFAKSNTWQHRAESAITHLQAAGLY